MDESLSPLSGLVSTRKAVSVALTLLKPGDRRKYRLVVAAQMVASLLDIVGVLLLGVVGMLATAAVQESGMPSALAPLAQRLGIDDVPLITLAAGCAALAAGFLLSKSVISALLMRRIFRFLGSRQGEISARLTQRLLSMPLLAIEQRSSQETVYAISTGVYLLITSMLGSFAILLSEMTLLILLFATLAFVDPWVTLASVAYFAAVGYGLHAALSAWARSVGQSIGESGVLGQQRLQEAMAAYREIAVLGRRPQYIASVNRLWTISGRSNGDSLFLMQLPKIAYETALVIGGVALVAWQFATQGTVHAIATVVLFVAAGSRVLPSMLRMNTLVLAIRLGTGQASSLFPLIRDLDTTDNAVVEAVAVTSSGAPLDYSGFEPTVAVDAVSITYPTAVQPALLDITFEIAAGSRIAIVGTTGAGKSTLADVVLGVVTPDAGRVLISGLPVSEAISRWPGAIAYVPQNVAMINGTVRENVSLGIDSAEVDDEQVWGSLAQAHLADLIAARAEGLNALIGERGVRLSGGQRQRLGLARALYSSPRLLVLDEATSALDAETESLISDTLGSLSRQVTIVTIAHRLATIQNADWIILLEDGVIRDRGSFADVRLRNPSFERQARLSGMPSDD
ncbi:MAG: ABC transporter ATP-binding protein [Candidatus Nanopelagicales bacterium]